MEEESNSGCEVQTLQLLSVREHERQSVHHCPSFRTGVIFIEKENTVGKSRFLKSS